MTIQKQFVSKKEDWDIFVRIMGDARRDDNLDEHGNGGRFCDYPPPPPKSYPCMIAWVNHHIDGRWTISWTVVYSEELA